MVWLLLTFQPCLLLTSKPHSWRRESSYAIAGNVNWYSHYREQHQSSSVQSLSGVRLFATPWTAARQASLSITNSWSLLKLMLIESAMPSNHLTLCCPLLFPPSIFPSIRVFSNESALHIRWPPDAKSGEQYGSSLKSKNWSSIWPCSPTPGHMIQTWSQRVHAPERSCGAVYSSQDVEET